MHTSDPLLTDLNSRLMPVRNTLKQAVEGRHVTIDVYHKTLLQIAYEYAVGGYASECLHIVLSVDSSYFRGPAVLQMKQDSVFQKQMCTVIEVLMVAGLLPTFKVAYA